MRRLLEFQHVLTANVALIAAVVLAWHGTLQSSAIAPIISAALLYGLGGQALANGRNNNKRDGPP